MTRLSKIYAGLAGAALVLASMPAAQAFTFENSDNSGGGNALAPSPFNDPVKKIDTDKNGMSKMQFGNTSIYVGGAQGNPEQDFRTGVNRMFSPLGRPGN